MSRIKYFSINKVIAGVTDDIIKVVASCKLASGMVQGDEIVVVGDDRSIDKHYEIIGFRQMDEGTVYISVRCERFRTLETEPVDVKTDARN